jgi:hypothetical protein
LRRGRLRQIDAGKQQQADRAQAQSFIEAQEFMRQCHRRRSFSIGSSSQVGHRIGDIKRDSTRDYHDGNHKGPQLNLPSVELSG